MSLLRYLAYGSNLHPVRLQRRVPSAQLIGSVTLSDWQLHFNKRSGDGSGKCNIVRNTGNVVHGAVFEMVAEEKLLLDRVEGRGYAVILLEVAGYGEVFSYQAHPDYIDETARPYDWYHKLVLAGAGYHDLPPSYLQHLEGFQAKEDPDPERAAKNFHILSQLDTIA